jgi:vacuolar-type H+-ATPase subunit H
LGRRSREGVGREKGDVIDIINIIDRIETLIETSKSVPVSGNVLIDKHKAMELVDQLRLAVPQEVRSAEEVLSNKDHILNQAQANARHTKSKAEDEFRQRLDQSELVTLAESRAEETLKDAEHRAARILEQSETEARSRRTDADTYALRSLRALERELAVLTGSVRKGIDVLAGQASVGLGADLTEGYASSEATTP